MSAQRHTWIPILLGGLGSLVGATALVGWVAVLTGLKQWWGFGLIALIGVAVVLAILGLLWRLLRTGPLSAREWRIIVSLVASTLLVAAVAAFVLVSRYAP